MSNEAVPSTGTVILSCSVSRTVKNFVTEYAEKETEKAGFNISVSNIVNRLLLKAKKELEENKEETKQ